MVFMTVEIAVEIAVHTVVTVVWIVFSTDETAVEIGRASCRERVLRLV